MTTLLNWSSRVTPRPTVPPAVMEPAGGVLMTSLFAGAKAETVKELDVAAVIEWVESVAVMVKRTRRVDLETAEAGHAAAGRHRGRAAGEAAGVES